VGIFNTTRGVNCTPSFEILNYRIVHSTSSTIIPSLAWEAGPQKKLNVTIITGLLVGPYAVAHIIHLNEMIAGCIGIAAVFAFNALGHFAKTHAMISMLPSFVPGRRILIHASGILEILFGDRSSC
jgi:hypothetical protein